MGSDDVSVVGGCHVLHLRKQGTHIAALQVGAVGWEVVMECCFCGKKYTHQNERECCGKSLTGSHYPFMRYDALVRAGEEAAARTDALYQYLRESAKSVVRG